MSARVLDFRVWSSRSFSRRRDRPSRCHPKEGELSCGGRQGARDQGSDDSLGQDRRPATGSRQGVSAGIQAWLRVGDHQGRGLPGALHPPGTAVSLRRRRPLDVQGCGSAGGTAGLPATLQTNPPTTVAFTGDPRGDGFLGPGSAPPAAGRFVRSAAGSLPWRLLGLLALDRPQAILLQHGLVPRPGFFVEIRPQMPIQ